MEQREQVNCPIFPKWTTTQGARDIEARFAPLKRSSLARLYSMSIARETNINICFTSVKKMLISILRDRVSLITEGYV